MEMREAAAKRTSRARHDEREEEEAVSHEAHGAEEVEEDEERVEEEEEEEVIVPAQRCVPRRPRRVIHNGMAAGRQRVPRVVVLNGHHGRVATSMEREVFMTHLPDSPPRGSILSRATIFQFADAQAKTPVSSQEADKETGEEEDQKDQKDREEVEEEETVEVAVATTAEEESRPEVDEACGEEHEEDEGEETCETSYGPNALDITPVAVASGEDCGDDSSSSASDTEDEEEEEDDDDEEEEEKRAEVAYQQLQAARIRIEAEQHERDALRSDLASYVVLLASKCDADGEKLVAFPRNFQQIVSLMTAQDLATSSAATSTARSPPATSASSAEGNKDPKSWSQILIQNSLAKQHAFGMLAESEDGTDGASSLAAKIALKMARIRQLDGVLEDKLGKNLYTVPTKKAKRVNPQEPEVVGRSPAVHATTPSVSTSRSSTSLLRSTPSQPPSSQPALNFVERNRKVVENGARANLTRDEEKRVKRLLREVKTTADELPETEATVMPVVSPMEFRLEPQQQHEIETLLAEKRGLYPSAIIMALDDVPEEDEAEPRASDPVVPQKKGKPGRKANIVQETKRERLHRQRLLRIEEELQFLHDHESVAILPDEGDDDDASDGCSSERSFMTTTSMLSTASTRSGVTRRQLDQFVAAEVTKAGEKASRHEIDTLLRSLAHLPMASARPATTATG